MLHWDPDKRASAECMLNHPWLTMPAVYDTHISADEREQLMAKQKLAQERGGEPLDLETGDAQVQYYHNAEMSKLTDSEGEYCPADDEWGSSFQSNGGGAKAKNTASTTNSAAANGTVNLDKLNAFLDNEWDDAGSGFYFSDSDDE